MKTLNVTLLVIITMITSPLVLFAQSENYFPAASGARTIKIMFSKVEALGILTRTKNNAFSILVLITSSHVPTMQMLKKQLLTSVKNKTVT